MAQLVSETYDEVPYEGQAYAQSHPDRLATIAHLHGLAAPAVERARVLELGCAHGGNLAPMAVSLPGARFVGVDASPRQIDAGKAMLERMGLSNVELRCLDLVEAGESLGQFDFVIAHGIYSWVAPEVAGHLLALCARSLAPNGVVYASYNTLPGWHMRAIVRELCLFHGRGVTGTRARAASAREALAWIRESLPDGGRHGARLTKELDLLTKSADSYLAHDHMSADNRPVYFEEFIAHAARHGLAYLDEADPELTCEHGTLPDAARARAMGKDDRVRAEQYLDFLRNREFRRTLLCRAESSLTRSPPPDAIERLFVASRVRPATPDPDVRRRGPVKFEGDAGELTTDHPLAKAALVHLASIAPRAIPFAELLASAKERLGDARPSDRDVDLLRRFLVRGFLASGAIELHAFAAPFVTAPGEHPVASASARDDAGRVRGVVSLLHTAVSLDEPLRALLPLVDGTRDRSALARDWGAALRRSIAPADVDRALAMFAQSALLVG